MLVLAGSQPAGKYSNLIERPQPNESFVQAISYLSSFNLGTIKIHPYVIHDRELEQASEKVVRKMFKYAPIN